MFSVVSRAGRLCDSTSRRELLTVGGMSLLGLALPEFLRQKANGAERPRREPRFGSADSIVLVYLQSHIGLWDPKPNAPAEIRGEFKPIETKTPGLYLGEVQKGDRHGHQPLFSIHNPRVPEPVHFFRLPRFKKIQKDKSS